jgi:hypothetical protein
MAHNAAGKGGGSFSRASVSSRFNVEHLSVDKYITGFSAGLGTNKALC